MDDVAGEKRCAQVDQAMRTWGDTVFRLALSRMGNRSDAEDITQTVFLRLLRHTEPFSSENHLKTWLLRVTINCCNDAFRSSWNRHRASLDETLGLFTEETWSLHEVWDAVGVLPDEQRDVVHLHYGEEYAIDEIATILSVKPTTVRVRLHRARKALRSLLGGLDGKAQF